MKRLLAIIFVFYAAPAIGMAQVGDSYYQASHSLTQPSALPPMISVPAMQDPAAGSSPPENCCIPEDSVAPQDIHTRTQLFGDWFGVRSGLEERGIVPKIYQTQFYQGVTGGGSNQTFKYGGKLDYEFSFIGEKMGLNKGFLAAMHAETRYGEDVNVDAGALSFVNTPMLYPFPEQQSTSITGLYAIQALNEKLALTIGKFRTLDLFAMIYPDARVRGNDGFMNLSMMLPVTLFRTTDLSLNAVGILGMKGEQVQSGLLVYDTKNVSTTVAPDLFGDGAVILGYHRFFTEFRGRPGSHGFLGNYSTRTYTSTDPLSWAIIPGEGVVAGQQTGSWALAYFLDQEIWADPCNKERNLRLYSVSSIADQQSDPWNGTANVSLQGTGLLRSRANDYAGVGYFYDGLSGGYKNLVSALPGEDLQNLQGFECYYNAAVTPWFRMTADFQVVDNENVGNKTAILFGLRGKIEY